MYIKLGDVFSMDSDSWVFYYDESMLSHVLSNNTIMANNFYNGFVTCIVGWKKSKEQDIFSKYSNLISSLKQNSLDEVKSNYFKPKDFKYGFKSVSKYKTRFLSSFLDFVASDDIFCQILVENKIVKLVSCLLEDYLSLSGLSYVAMVYSVSNLILNYKPKKVVQALTNNDKSLFLNEFLSFANQLLLRPDMDKYYMLSERFILEQLVYIFTNFNCFRSIPFEEFFWDYDLPFSLLKKHIDSLNLDVGAIYIDGEYKNNGNEVYDDACFNFDENIVHMMDSKLSYGIQIADMFAGILSKLFIALNCEVGYGRNIEDTYVRHLSQEWFNVTDSCLKNYNTLKYIFEHKSRPIGFYFDINYVTLECFLSCVEEFSKIDCAFEDKSISFNQLVNYRIDKLFSNMPTNDMLHVQYNMRTDIIFCDDICMSKGFDFNNYYNIQKTVSFFGGDLWFIESSGFDWIDVVRSFIDTHLHENWSLCVIDILSGSCVNISCSVCDIVEILCFVYSTEKGYPVYFVGENFLNRCYIIGMPFYRGRICGNYKVEDGKLKQCGD